MGIQRRTGQSFETRFIFQLAVDTLGHKSRIWFDEKDKEIRGLLEDKQHLHKAYHDKILAQYSRGQPTRTSERQSSTDSEACKIPG